MYQKKKKHQIVNGKKVCIYLRYSTKEQETGFSIEYQLNACKEYIEKNSLEMYKIYTDEGISGTVPAKDRKEFKMLLMDAEFRKFDAVIFHAFDRLARDMTVAYEIVGMLEKHGIRILECQHDIDTSTEDGKNRMGMYFLFAQMEHGHIKNRSKYGTEARRKKIGWIGGKVPYGYIKKDDDKKSIPIINVEQANIVKVIYALYWEYKYPLTKIQKYLIDNKIEPGKYSASWTIPYITRILKEHKMKYDGELINNNENGIRWPEILDIDYPEYPRKGYK